MQADQLLWKSTSGWEKSRDGNLDNACLVLAFGAREALENKAAIDDLQEMYKGAQIAFSSTSGEIHESEIYDGTISAVAFQFRHTKIDARCVQIDEYSNSFDAGKALAEQFSKDDLRHLFILSDGHKVNGTALVRGLSEGVSNSVNITGGLAGDADRFSKTLVGLNQMPKQGCIVAVGFYGGHIQVGHGCKGGWDAFGPIRKITRSEENVLYELDGKSALELYKSYLGDKARGLPSTGLLFPIAILQDDCDPIVRTILSIDEDTQSLTFAGEMPEGARVQLMRANFERLIEGAAVAASDLLDNCDVAVLISCVGRRLVLGQRTEEEVESIRDNVGPSTILTGFYSYGEISPHLKSSRCRLHNQTMTITAFKEV